MLRRFSTRSAACLAVLKEVFHAYLHDWDIVSCHYFITTAVLRGLLELPDALVAQLIPTILRYNAACYEDMITGRGKEHNTFLLPIDEWYDVKVGEAKLGCLIVLNFSILSSRSSYSSRQVRFPV